MAQDNSILIQKLQGIKAEIAALDVAIEELDSKRLQLHVMLEEGIAVLLSGEDDVEIVRSHIR